MPIPQPTTPKDSSVSCNDGGPSLETPDLKGYSLSDSDKNEIMFIKSRSGNLIAFDDHDKTLRLQQKTGNAEIRMTDKEIEIKQKTGDVTFISEKETRWDCTSFLVHAKNDISFNAGTDYLLVTGNMETESMKDTSFTSDKNHTWISWNTFSAKAMGEIAIVGKKKTSVAAKQKGITCMALKTISMTSKQDFGAVAKSALTMTGLMGCDFKSNNKITLLSSGPFIGMSMCININ